jgi:predicted NBD/HSP70 family sugar kinase
LSEGQGSNSASVRQFNERVILSALRRLGRASKADLARQARLTDNTAGVIVRDLAARDLVRFEGKRVGGRGQPATLLSLNADGAYSIGVKIGRRSIDATLVDFAGHGLRRISLERSFPPPGEAVTLTLSLLDELLKGAPRAASTRLAGLGVAIPYSMGSWRRELDISDAAYAAWNDFNVGAVLAQRTRLPVFVENDGTAAAVAELFKGHGREVDSFIYLFIGTAIGGGVVLEGDFERGESGNAGDFGLMPVPPSRLPTAPRPAGAYDILLTRASISSLMRHLRANQVHVASRGELDAALVAHPGLFAEWRDDCADALVIPVLSATRILDVGTVIIDGALPRRQLEALAASLRATLAENRPESRGVPDVLVGKIGGEAAAVGAAILPLHFNFNPSRSLLLGRDPASVHARITA